MIKAPRKTVNDNILIFCFILNEKIRLDIANQMSYLKYHNLFSLKNKQIVKKNKMSTVLIQT